MDELAVMQTCSCPQLQNPFPLQLQRPPAHNTLRQGNAAVPHDSPRASGVLVPHIKSPAAAARILGRGRAWDNNEGATEGQG